MMVQRSFNINVRNGGADGAVIYTYADISSAPDAENSLSNVMVHHLRSATTSLPAPSAAHWQTVSPVIRSLLRFITCSTQGQ